MGEPMTRRPWRRMPPPNARAALPLAAAEAAALADRLARLRPDWRDAEAFFEERAELVHELRGLARRMGAGDGRA